MLNVVLVEPEIPPNTGNIARLCLATNSCLHLVKPLGFQTTDRALRRAGMDYWKRVNISYWENWLEFEKATSAASRLFFFSTKARQLYWNIPFRDHDYLIFGRETRGLPESLLEAYPDRCFLIPMDPAARSLNLATAVAIVLFEGIRQMSAQP